ncbi:MAG: WYL domain-containing protein [Streptosporangiales bacterium]|nr:WYL domain-containing protein [Streptosporangiales bacterium]
MNRTDRLYAIVEELRASAPRHRSARELAQRYEVSVRTIERDIGALQQAGVPIYADVGRRGGYALDKTMTLPPLNFTPAEAVAVAVALNQANGTPFARASRSAVRKIVTAMSARDAHAARDLASRVRIFEREDAVDPPSVPSVIEEAIVAQRVLRLSYTDRNGVRTERDVEPVLFVSDLGRWYLVGWCRLRDGARAFRVDRVVSAAVTGEPAPARSYEEFVPRIPDLVARGPALD